MTKSFDNLLSDLGHVSARSTEGANSYDLSIDERRQFRPAEGFNTTIAFEGDINSIELVIDMPIMHARHELAQCQFKELKWKNLKNGAEGISTLSPISGGTTGRALYVWEVPADVCANAGSIEISISFYDKSVRLDGEGNPKKDAEGKDILDIAFAWNTASYSGLKVEATMSSVGTNMPALDDVLLIDEETHNILSPNGYNNTICNYGDKGTVDVYFTVNRYLGRNHGLDVLGAKCQVFVVVVMNNKAGCDNTNITTIPYSYEISGRQNEGMALITWHVPAGITAGNAGPNAMKIAVGFDDGTHRWVSNTYEKLAVGHSLFEVQEGEPGAEWGLTDDYIAQVIDNYFNNGMVVFDPEA